MVVGLGTQDSVELADEFVDTYGTTFPMLWDETFQTWAELGVTGQPAALLLNPDGSPIQGWRGGIPEDEVLRLVASVGG